MEDTPDDDLLHPALDDRVSKLLKQMLEEGDRVEWVGQPGRLNRGKALAVVAPLLIAGFLQVFVILDKPEDAALVLFSFAVVAMFGGLFGFFLLKLQRQYTYYILTRYLAFRVEPFLRTPLRVHGFPIEPGSVFQVSYGKSLANLRFRAPEFEAERGKSLKPLIFRGVANADEAQQALAEIIRVNTLIAVDLRP